MAATPMAARTACTAYPKSTPASALRAAERPPDSPCDITNNMSGPGVMTRGNTAAANNATVWTGMAGASSTSLGLTDDLFSPTSMTAALYQSSIRCDGRRSMSAAPKNATLRDLPEEDIGVRYAH